MIAILYVLAALAARPVLEARPALLILTLARRLAAAVWDIAKEGKR